MAILNNLREVRTWMDSAAPHVVPQWQVDLLMKEQAMPSNVGALPSLMRPPISLKSSRQTPQVHSSTSTNTNMNTNSNIIINRSINKLPLPSVAASRTRFSVPYSMNLNLREETTRNNIPQSINTNTNTNICADSLSACPGSPRTKNADLNKGPGAIPAAVPALSKFDWLDDELFLDEMIDISLFRKPQEKRQAEAETAPDAARDPQPAKRQRTTLSPAPAVVPLQKLKDTLPPRETSPIICDSGTVSSPKDTDVQALQSYILACESKIDLLTKCNAVSDSTSLSLDAKKLWHAQKFVPKMKDIDAKVHGLRAGFTFLAPFAAVSSSIRSESPLSKPLSLCIVSSPEIAPSPSSRFSQDILILIGTSKDYGLQESVVSVTTPVSTDHPHRDAFDTNLEEARCVVLKKRAKPQLSKPMLDTIDDEASEDNFGGGFMDGLRSSQADENDTDLSGFIAKGSDDDASSIDVTFTCTQGTQLGNRIIDTDDDEDAFEEDENHSVALRHDGGSVQDELASIKLSQDVAERYGISYENPNENEQVEEDEDNLEVVDVDAEDTDHDEISDFSTQLKEARDEAIEVVDCDLLDDEDFADIEPKTFGDTVSGAAGASDHDLSDDDDILQLTKPQASAPTTAENSRPVIPGSEPFIDEVYAVLSDTFKLPGFRSNQLEAVVATLLGKDVFVLIPTGGGKSLCYQLPALVTKGKTRGTTVVISPLISLMQDQIQHLQKRNIRAEMISSRGTAQEKCDVLRSLAAGNLDLVYLSPEMVNKAQSVRRILAKLYDSNMLARVVVDEAHCVSSWGHDFRPDYQGICMFKENFPRVPIMALTATASEKVRLDIVNNLRMRDPLLLKQSFNRTNLFYKVMKKPTNVLEWLRDYISLAHRGKTGIIYCHLKQSCENTAEKLALYGVRCKYYHAGMDADERLNVQTQWQENRIQVICATIAFGMGIDKPDVRFVIHIYVPRTLEGYYQETGRAGRDGAKSECIMFYAYKDARKLKGLIEKDRDLEYTTKEMHLAKLRQVVQYCENGTDCRRRQVLHYFNENFEARFCHKKCDNCCNDIASVRRDVTVHCANIVKLVHTIYHDKVTVIHCQDVYWGSKNQKIVSLGHHQNPYHGAGRDLDKGAMERVFFYLQCENALLEYQVVKGGYAASYVKLGPHANSFMKAAKKIELLFPQQKQSLSAGAPRLVASGLSTGNGVASELTNFRYQDSFMSAREVRNQDDAEKENKSARKVPSRIVLPRDTFGGKVNASNQELIDKAFHELRSLRMLKLQELGYARSVGLVSDSVLKEMAIKLPTNAKDYGKLKGVTRDLADHFVYFKKALITLSRERKKVMGTAPVPSDGPTQQAPVHLSPYFPQSPAVSVQKSGGGQKRQRRDQKSGKRTKQALQRAKSLSAKPNAAPRLIRQMPI